MNATRFRIEISSVHLTLLDSCCYQFRLWREIRFRTKQLAKVRQEYLENKNSKMHHVIRFHSTLRSALILWLEEKILKRNFDLIPMAIELPKEKTNPIWSGMDIGQWTLIHSVDVLLMVTAKQQHVWDSKGLVWANFLLLLRQYICECLGCKPHQNRFAFSFSGWFLNWPDNRNYYRKKFEPN